MNIDQAFTIYGGGQGSGPTAPCAQCGPHTGHKISHSIEEGDLVKLKHGDTLWNTKTGNVDKFGPGLRAVVVNVLPKVGSNPQMIKVNILPPGKKPKHEADQFRYKKLEDVELHKAADTKNPIQEIKPVPKSKTIIKFKSADGADVTWIKPHIEGEHDPKSIKEIAETPHYLKGNFNLTQSMKGYQDRPGYTRVVKQYETTGMPYYVQKGYNATVQINTYSQKGKIKEIVINEQKTTDYSMKTSGILSFSYKPGFKDGAAKAVGMLKSRYGIKTTMARLSKAKFGVQ